MVLFRRLLGDVLRDARMQRGLTLREVSADARVSLGYISEIERGQKEASSELLASLCSALDMPLSDVLREVSDLVAIEEAAAHPDSRSRARAGGESSPPPPDLGTAPAGRTGTSTPHAHGPARPSIAVDRGPAAAAPRLSRRVDPEARRRSPVVATGSPLDVLLQHQLGPSHQAAQVRYVADRRGRGDPADEAQLGGVHVADAGEVALVEQRLPDRPVGLAVSRRSASSSSQSGPSRSGPRCPTISDSHSRGISSTTPSEKPTATDRSVASTARTCSAGRRQRSSRRVGAPRALHLQVGVQRERLVGVDPGEEVLAAGHVSTTVAPLRSAVAMPRDPEVGADERSPDSARSRRCAVRWTVSPSGTGRPQPQALRGGDESGRLQRLAQGRRTGAEQLLAVGLLDREPAERAAADGVGQAWAAGRVSSSASSVQVSRVRPPRSTYSVSDPSTSTTIAPALRPGRWPDLGVLAARGARRRTGWRGPSPPGRRRRLGVGRDLAEGAQPVDRARRAELGGAEPGDEVAAAAPTGLLERRQHLVDGGEPARDPLAHHGAADDDPVPIEQPLRGRVGPPGRVGVERRQQRPAAGGLRWPAAGGHPRPAGRWCGSAPAAACCGARASRRG